MSPSLIEDDLGLRVVLAQSQLNAGTYAVLSSFGGVTTITPAGTVLGATPTASANGMAIDTKGNYILAAIDSLLKVNPDGDFTVITNAPHASQFVDVACDAAGNYIVADNTMHQILRISSDGSTATSVVQYPVQNAEEWEDASVRVLGSRNYLLTEDNGSRAHLFIITPTGNLTNIELAGVLPTSVGGLTIDAGGNYIITDYLNAAIDVITPSGVCSTLVQNFDFNEITGIAWDWRNGTFVVTDEGDYTVYSVASDGSSVVPILLGLVPAPIDVALVPPIP